MRRRDYVLSHPFHVPNIRWAAEQIKKKLRYNNLAVVFISSDAYDAGNLKKKMISFKEIINKKNLIRYFCRNRRVGLPAVTF